MNKTSNEQKIVRDYLDTFFSPNPDFDFMRALLKNEFTFAGPLINAASADEYIALIKSMGTGQLKADIVSIIAEGQEVAVLYDLVTPFGSFPTVEWFRVHENKIASIRLLNDPRPFLQAFDNK